MTRHDRQGVLTCTHCVWKKRKQRDRSLMVVARNSGRGSSNLTRGNLLDQLRHRSEYRFGDGMSARERDELHLRATRFE